MEDFNNQSNRTNNSKENQVKQNNYPTRTGELHFRKRKHPWVWPIILIILVIAGIGLIWLHSAYNNAQNTFQKTYQQGNVDKRNVSKIISRDKPFSVLLLGTDTGALGRHDKGRTDTMILATINPQKKTIFLTSIPRDTKVTVPGDSQPYEKVNAAYTLGGPSKAVTTVQRLLNVPIDFYAIINMGGLEKMVNAVNGVKVDPPLSFHYQQANVKKGHETTLNGKQALAYSRMSHQDPRGDFGREQRQRQVLEKLLMKGLNITSLPRYKKILASLQGNLKTDIKFDDMVSIRARYGVATHHLSSDGLKEYDDTLNGIDYEVPTKSELIKISKEIRKNLGLSDTSDVISNNYIDNYSDSDSDDSYII
ncbi:MAG: LytR family transcriptional regulator [Acetilactobacillus jinshanensis]